MQQPKEHSFDAEKFISWLGRFASVIAILMYVSYIAQIINNLHGQYAAPLQPFVAGEYVNRKCNPTFAYTKCGRFARSILRSGRILIWDQVGCHSLTFE